MSPWKVAWNMLQVKNVQFWLPSDPLAKLGSARWSLATYTKRRIKDAPFLHLESNPFCMTIEISLQSLPNWVRLQGQLDNVWILIVPVNNYQNLAVLNSNQAGEGAGWNLPTATLTACRYVLDGVMTVKPSCNFHFWCLKSF